MTEHSLKRKLNAILCADVMDYSRMMGEESPVNSPHIAEALKTGKIECGKAFRRLLLNIPESHI